MDKKQLTILNDIARLHDLQAFIEAAAEAWELPAKLSMNINLVLEEVISNIIFYGFEDESEHVIKVDLVKTGEEIIITVTDDARPFDLLATEDFKDNEKAAEDREIGGLGIHFVKTLMDKMEYRREEDQNILMLWKKL